MARRVEGYISKKVIKRWLEEYDYLAAGDRPPDAPPTNSGPKAYDGVSAGKLNKIMLDQAIDRLPPLMKACIRARYIYKLPLKATLRALGIGPKIYYNRCDLAIRHIYYQLNGRTANIMDLLKEIKREG
jgi:DNA-directed RNA polymerase specialized sigma24 family protein